MSRAIDDVLDRAVDRGAVPNVVAVAADNSGVTYRGAAGAIAPGDDRTVDANTEFRIMSMTKMIVTAAALQQRDAGRLDFMDKTHTENSRAVISAQHIPGMVYPAEVDRVLGTDGVVVWINSRGSDTPIHLTAAEVDEALPGTWAGVASRAGWGTWSVHWRTETHDGS